MRLDAICLGTFRNTVKQNWHTPAEILLHEDTDVKVSVTGTPTILNLLVIFGCLHRFPFLCFEHAQPPQVTTIVPIHVIVGIPA